MEQSDFSRQKGNLNTRRPFVFGILGGIIQLAGAASIKYTALGEMGHITQFAIDMMFTAGMAAGLAGLLCAFLAYKVPVLGGTIFMFAAVVSAVSISGGNMAAPAPMLLFLLAGAATLDNRPKRVKAGE